MRLRVFSKLLDVTKVLFHMNRFQVHPSSQHLWTGGGGGEGGGGILPIRHVS